MISKEVALSYRLSAEEEKVLFTEYKENGSSEARQKLWLSLLSISHIMAFMRYGKELDKVETYFSALTERALRAVEKFDPELGFRLTTYFKASAGLAIYDTQKEVSTSGYNKSHITMHINACKYIARKHFNRELMHCSDLELDQISKLYGYTKQKRVNSCEYYTHLKISVDSIKYYLVANKPEFSLEDALSNAEPDTDTGTKADHVADINNVGIEHQLTSESVHHSISLILKEYASNSRSIRASEHVELWKKRVYEEKTLQELGNEYGFSRERSRQIIEKVNQYIKLKTQNKRKYLF